MNSTTVLSIELRNRLFTAYVQTVQCSLFRTYRTYDRCKRAH